MLLLMSRPGNDLASWFESHDGHLIQTWMHYFEGYDRHFARFRGTDVVVLEIGVAQGGSIEMWKAYFGPHLRYYGIDIDPRCAQFEGPGVEIFIGSQSDPEFLKSVADRIPPIDIVIDDGGHTMRQQHVTFDVLFDRVKDGGVFLVEDLHTSYQADFGGGYRRRGTFIERMKSLVDNLNAFHSEQRGLVPDKYSRTITSLHFYDSMLFIEKTARSAPVEKFQGTVSFKDEPTSENLSARLRRRGLRDMNRVLRTFRIQDINTS